jgi:hypothetical protein
MLGSSEPAPALAGAVFLLGGKRMMGDCRLRDRLISYEINHAGDRALYDTGYGANLVHALFEFSFHRMA